MKLSRFLDDDPPWKPTPRVAHLWRGRLVIYCPGCEDTHQMPVEAGHSCRWQWNGSLDRPTLQPSVHVIGRCHSWINDGKIQFLSDCTHKLAGQTVPLPAHILDPVYFP